MTDAKVLAQMSSTAVQQRCMRYRKHNSTNYLPKTGRPKKISDQELKTLVRLVDNMVGVSQRRLGRRFELNQLICEKSNSLKLYKNISPNCQLILDDEKYFTLSGNVPGNNPYYSSDPSSAPEHIKLNPEKMYSWPSSLFHQKHHQNDDILFWPDLASYHYAYSTLHCLESNNVPYVRRSQNPPNVPQCRPIENIWALIEQMVYQGGCEAKNLDQLANRIKSKIKQLDQTVVTTMLQDIRGKLLKMYQKVKTELGS
ncbi:unnamed protein product [Rotaria socialis]|uniref:Transposase n=1 Tax=Rotaria socialis TaxID=392032 RepID=A0A821QT47_9BILA|nr:unnamed protein product [Rotaria socialis]CAF4523183.1 unnamed protein product [Rotaria socialis]CAF4628030.1 unnamed protein product [Rotaria socialis]CAF4831690.1 unnamed protein product [Rotaria socialis]